jgi:hypothetical protein
MVPMPFNGADIRQEPFSLPISRNQFSVYMARIPINEDTAKVEDDSLDRAVRHILFPKTKAAPFGRGSMVAIRVAKVNLGVL